MSNASSSFLLSAITKRSSDSELERLQTIGTCLLSALKRNSTNYIQVERSSSSSKAKTKKIDTKQSSATAAENDGDTATQEKNNQNEQEDEDEEQLITSMISNASIIHKALAWSNASPRFIYLASPSTIVRSADRGQTWKQIPVPSILSSSSSSSSSNTSTTTTTTTNSTSGTTKPPKILKIASCSKTGAVAFCGTQSLVCLSLKIGGPFQHLTPSLLTSTSTSSSSFNTIFFDSSGLLLFVGNANHLFVYTLASSVWSVVFSSSSSSSSSLSISSCSILRESIHDNIVEIGIFFGSSTSSSTSSSISGVSDDKKKSAILSKKSVKPTKTLQKVEKELASLKKDDDEATKKERKNKQNNPSSSELLVGGIGGLQMFQVSRSNGKVMRKSVMIPHKLGSVLKCQEIPIFYSSNSTDNNSTEQPPSSIALRRFKWCSRWRPNNNNNNNRSSTSNNITNNNKSRNTNKREYDYTIGSVVPSSQIPFVSEFFSVGGGGSDTSENNNDHNDVDDTSTLIESLPQDDPFLVTINTTTSKSIKKKQQTNSKNKTKDDSDDNDSSDSDDDDDDDDIQDTFRGGFFPRTAPRLLACYSSGGRVVDSDATSFLWVWFGERDDQDDEDNEDDHENNQDQDAAAIYTTVTNVSYLPLVQSSSSSSSSHHQNNNNNSSHQNHPVGLSVLNHGRHWLRCGINGVSTSFDGGRTWTEPQLSCMVAACALGSLSQMVVCSRPGFALLPELEKGSSTTTNSATITSTTTKRSTGSTSSSTQQRSNSSSTHWNLTALPSNLSCSVMSDGTVLY